MKMKITNHTVWNTGDLRKIFRSTISRNISDEGKLQTPILIVTVKHAHQERSPSGRAWYYGNRIIINIPKEPCSQCLSNLSSEVATVFYHELQHVRGYTHQEIGRHYTNEDMLNFKNLPELRRNNIPTPSPKKDMHLYLHLEAWKLKAKFYLRHQNQNKFTKSIKMVNHYQSLITVSERQGITRRGK